MRNLASGIASAPIAAVLLCLGASAASGADPAAPSSSGSLVLETAIREGLARSPMIQRAEAAAEESRWKSTEAIGDGFLPKISASASHFFATSYEFTNIVFAGTTLSFPGIYPTTQLTVNATVPIFDGLSNVNKARSASLMQDAAEQDLDRTKFELSQQIQLSFYQALAAAMLEEVASQNVKTLDDHLKQVDIQRNGGAATNYDTLRVQVQLNEARSDAIDTHDNAQLARKKLSQLMGLAEDPRPLEGQLPELDPKPVEQLEMPQAPSDRADIRALEMRAEADERSHSAEKAWFVPSISLGGQYFLYDELLYNSAVVDTNDFQSAYNFGIFLNWNIFDGGVSLARAHEASAHAIQSSFAAEEAKLQVPYDFAYWKKRYLSNIDHYESKKLDVSRSEESVRLAKEEERQGSRTSTEVLDAELDLFRSKAGVVTSLVNAVEAKIKLELALGRKI